MPTFKDIYCNEMIHNYSEKKAELFYNKNYINKKEKNLFKRIMVFLKKLNRMMKIVKVENLILM